MSILSFLKTKPEEDYTALIAKRAAQYEIDSERAYAMLLAGDDYWTFPFDLYTHSSATRSIAACVARLVREHIKPKI
jgi:hypothetical protein